MQTLTPNSRRVRNVCAAQRKAATLGVELRPRDRRFPYHEMERDGYGAASRGRALDRLVRAKLGIPDHDA